MLNKRFNNIKELRKKEGLTQKDLAELLGITRSYLSEIETGKKMPGGEIVIKLSMLFNTPPEEIFFTKLVHHSTQTA